MECIICGSGSLGYFNDLENLPSVSSDCKLMATGVVIYVCKACGHIQKSMDVEWCDHVEKIYSEYDIYDLSSGNEQMIFYSTLTNSSTRSSVMLDFLSGYLRSMDNKKVLVVNLHGGNEEVMEALSIDLQKAVPACNVEYYDVNGHWANLKPEDWEKMVSCDAAILGHNY